MNTLGSQKEALQKEIQAQLEEAIAKISSENNPTNCQTIAKETKRNFKRAPFPFRHDPEIVAQLIEAKAKINDLWEQKLNSWCVDAVLKEEQSAAKNTREDPLNFQKEFSVGKAGRIFSQAGIPKITNQREREIQAQARSLWKSLCLDGHKQAITDAVCNGTNPQNLAKQLGFSRQRAFQIIQKAGVDTKNLKASRDQTKKTTWLNAVASQGSPAKALESLAPEGWRKGHVSYLARRLFGTKSSQWPPEFKILKTTLNHKIIETLKENPSLSPEEIAQTHSISLIAAKNQLIRAKKNIQNPPTKIN